ncbi:hypothetical protein BABINDRAFT_42590 [Babjeviella inositovora NRRL Y-12698]|uniref:MoaB/Mog domain-containing protein n=1 Tax=Babjeviella inositovora NRRL Y-12698 TaxID=984486 RepID=A0A1E3QIZ2_9ASCO|nr:uncharacterized protein BABINDRAFT_42590 [Babjeviella inositovora NRRL Y-12698]ODQ76947.1 hypothetical protein BABINDRAFT_42590 [Babjeviella inositovora NRRL Y-12698]
MSLSIRSAAILIIGDEVLNSKIRDLNSYTFAKFCFAHGITLKAISVVGDEALEIASEIRRMSAKYDFIVTSGGIGPTHDDITYEALATAFNLPLRLDETVVKRMKQLRSQLTFDLNPEQLAAQYRMATFPFGPEVKNIITDESLWVPVVAIRNQVHVLPGVPQLFSRLLTGLGDILKPRFPDLSSREYLRYYVKTSISESRLAPYLTSVQNQWDATLASEAVDDRIKIGSYPHMGLRINTISIIGLVKFKSQLREIVAGVVENLEGQEISKEEEDQMSVDMTEIKL